MILEFNINFINVNGEFYVYIGTSYENKINSFFIFFLKYMLMFFWANIKF